MGVVHIDRFGGSGGFPQADLSLNNNNNNNKAAPCFEVGCAKGGYGLWDPYSMFIGMPGVAMLPSAGCSISLPA